MASFVLVTATSAAPTRPLQTSKPTNSNLEGRIALLCPERRRLSTTQLILSAEEVANRSAQFLRHTQAVYWRLAAVIAQERREPSAIRAIARAVENLRTANLPACHWVVPVGPSTLPVTGASARYCGRCAKRLISPKMSSRGACVALEHTSPNVSSASAASIYWSGLPSAAPANWILPSFSDG